MRLQSTRCRPASKRNRTIYQTLQQGTFAGCCMVLSPISARSADEVVNADVSVFHLDGLLQGAPRAKSRHFV